MYVIIRRHLDGPNAILILRCIKMILDDGDCTLHITVESVSIIQLLWLTAQNSSNCNKSKMCLNVLCLHLGSF